MRKQIGQFLRTLFHQKQTHQTSRRRLQFDSLEPRRVLTTFGITPQYDVQVTSDIVYRNDAKVGHGTSEGVTNKSLKLDLYKPTGENLPQQLPAAILIHGGGFVGGDKAQSSFVSLSNDFAERGYVTVSINYRLFGDNVPPAKDTPFSDLDERYDTFVAGVEDSFHAIKWVKDSADSLGIDPERIVLGGHSAGGFLSMAAGMFDTQDVNFFSHMQLDVSQLGVTAILDGAGSLQGTEYTIDADDPATFVMHSTDDTVVTIDSAEKIVTELQNDNVSYEFPTITTAGHGLEAKLNTVIDGVKVSDQMFAFFERELDLEALTEPEFNWHNENLPQDVNNDGAVTPVDVLHIINELNTSGSYELPHSKPNSSPFYDVNRDGWITPSDAISVINALNAESHSVEIGLFLTNSNGETISTVSLDKVFYINLTTEDVTAEAAGVFAAYVDLYLPATHLEFAGSASYVSPFINGQSGTANSAGELDEWGAFAGIEKTGAGEMVMSRIPVRAIRTGPVLVLMDSADDRPLHDVLLYDRESPVEPVDVYYESLGFEILAN